MKDDMKMIDCTPTWRGLLPAMVTGARDAETMEARKTMRDELLRMASMSEVMSEAELLELIEAQYTSTSIEASKAAKAKLEALADAADICIAQAKREREEESDDDRQR